MKKKASNSEILKQVLYEMLTLSHLIEIISKIKCVRGQSHVDSSESLQTTAMLKISLLHDFLYCGKEDAATGGDAPAYTARDDFNITLKKPSFVGCGPKGMFSRQSINSYIVNFTEARISNPKELPQPKFKGGIESTVKNSKLILSSAEHFIDGLVKACFTNLNQESECYLMDFKHTLKRLREEKIF